MVGLQDLEALGVGIASVAVEGRYLVAQRKFHAGEVIFEETPISANSKEGLAEQVSAQHTAFSLLGISLELEQISARCGAQLSAERMKVETNCFAMSTGFYLFNAASLLNHACTASAEENCSLSIYSQRFSGYKVDRVEEGQPKLTPQLCTDACKVVAIKDIDPGTPLRISYNEFVAPQKLIAAQCSPWPGGCKCSICTTFGLHGGHPFLQGTFEPACCQHCGGGSCHCAGDIVTLRNLKNAEFNGLVGTYGALDESKGRARVTIMRWGTPTEIYVKPEHVIGSQATPGLLRCSACSLVYYCSPVCQKADWHNHKQLCSKSTCEVDRGQNETLDERVEAAMDPDIALARYQKAEWYVRKWTQQGRRGRLLPFHQSVQIELSQAISTGSFLISIKHPSAVNLAVKVVDMLFAAHKCIKSMLPRFHVHHFNLLRTAVSLRQLANTLPGASGGMLARKVSCMIEPNLDVLKLYDEEMATNFHSFDEMVKVGEQAMAAMSSSFQDDGQAMMREIEAQSQGKSDEEKMAILMAKLTPKLQELKAQGAVPGLNR
jgi:hypothetical protein